MIKTAASKPAASAANKTLKTIVFLKVLVARKRQCMACIVGCVVDWLLEPSVAGGWESGRRLAAFLEAGIEEKTSDDGQGEWKFNEGANDNFKLIKFLNQAVAI